MADRTTHLVGLLLGAEEDWPTAFESILRMVGTVQGRSGAHDFTSERLTIEPFELTDAVRPDLVIDRLAYWYYHPREWLKFCAEHLPDLPERVHEWVQGPAFERLLRETVAATYPPHEQDDFTAHFQGLLGLWVQDEGSRLGVAAR